MCDTCRSVDDQRCEARVGAFMCAASLGGLEVYLHRVLAAHLANFGDCGVEVRDDGAARFLFEAIAQNADKFVSWNPICDLVTVFDWKANRLLDTICSASVETRSRSS